MVTLVTVKIIKSIVEKVRFNESLKAIKIPITRRALVIGGGISGIQAAIDVGSCIIFFPEGVYVVSAALEVTTPCILLGSGHITTSTADTGGTLI